MEELGLNTVLCVSVVSPAVLLDEIEGAEADGNDERIEGLLCGAVKQLKLNRAKPDITLYLSLMYLAKIKPNIFGTEGVIEVGTSWYFDLLTHNMNKEFRHLLLGCSLLSVRCNYVSKSD